ncbi:DUF6461 domain-containing protein [Streptomyces sp. NPDC058274]|uniref:DUF6461 domain-containing protein n=1 Tax=Streptomyces sp. NPDC058274 TaxID=3346416 RepID=UPI0036E5F4AE
MAELLDLTDVLGEGGCVTLVRRGLIEVMSAMGVEGVREVRWVEVADRLGELPRAELRDLPVMMLARSLPSGWTVVVEVDGWTGWVGAQRDVLERLSEGGGAAASLWRSPNNEEVLYAEDGEILGGFDPTTGHRWGAHQDKFGPVAEALGFSLSGVEDQGEDLLPLSVGQRCACALEALTGVRLTRAMFDDPWQGGLRRV